MEQIWFLSLLYFAGLFPLGLLLGREDGFLAGILAIPVGGIVFVVAAVVCLSTGIPYQEETMLSILSGWIACWGCASVFQKSWTFRAISTSILTYLAMVGLILPVTLSDYTAFTNDSFHIVDIGRSFVVNQAIAFDVEGGPGSFGVFMPTLQSAASFLNLEYLGIIPPAFGLCLIVGFIYLVRRSLRLLNVTPFVALAASIASAGTIFTSWTVVLKCFYIHTNLSSGLYLFFAVSTFWIGVEKRSDSYFILSFIMLLGLALQRTEGPIVALLVLGLMGEFHGLCSRLRRQLSLIFLCPLLLWLLVLYRFLQDNSGVILNVNRVAIMLAGIVLFFIGISLSKYKFVAWIQRQFSTLVLVSLGIIVVVLLFAMPQHMKSSAEVMFSTMFLTDRWGVSWHTITVLFLLSLRFSETALERFLRRLIIVFGLWMFALVGFSGGYVSHWSDSGNRMLMHILPVSMYYVVLRFRTAFSDGSCQKILQTA